MFITGRSLPRRTFLRGIGATVALPFLDAMVPALSARAIKPIPRYGFVYIANGVIQDQWTPATTGAGFELTPTLQPFANGLVVLEMTGADLKRVLEEQFGSLDNAFSKFRGKALLVSFDTDWLFPTKEVTRIHEAMKHVDARHLVISTPNGHDAFLVDYPLVNPPVREFLAGLAV